MAVCYFTGFLYLRKIVMLNVYESHYDLFKKCVVPFNVPYFELP